MRFSILVFFLCSFASLTAQPVAPEVYDLKLRRASLEEALYKLSDLTGTPISFSNTAVEGVKGLSYSFKKKSLEEMLGSILSGTGFHYERMGRQILVLRNIPASSIKFSLSGFLYDKGSGEPLIGATVYLPGSGKGTATNEYGFYSLTLPEGTLDIVFSYLGYQPESLPLDLRSDQVINLGLEASVTLEEIVVTSTSISIPHTFSSAAGKSAILQEEMEGLPSINGEPDLLRLLYLLPGVQTGADGFGGLSVRGGDIDQNLVLLDGVPVYNATHLLGAFSIFNSSAIRSSQLVKGVIPARYGGRVSSVLDVRTKEGSNKEWLAEADLGLATGKVSLEGPLVPGKSSVFVGARRAFIDLFSRPLTRKILEDRGADGELGYYFFDVNAKVNYKLGHRDHLYASFYTGGDDFTNDQSVWGWEGDTSSYDQASQGVKWGNTIGSFRWNHLFSSRLFSNTTLTFSRFFYGSGDEYERKSYLDNSLVNREYLYFRYHSNNRDIALTTDFDFRPHPDQTIRFGASAVLHRFQPGAISFDEEVLIDTLTDETIDILLERTAQVSSEYDVYIEDEFQISDEFGGNIGLRGTFLHIGGELLAYVQPRVQLAFRPRPQLIFTLGVGRHVQPLHLLTNSGVGLPRDLWVSSTSRIRPVDSWQLTGALRWTGLPGWIAEVEGYYKSMEDLITFQEGLLASIDATNWQNKVAVGDGWAYGAEWILKRQGNRFSGWLSYALSYSRRRFEEINFGESFPFRFDRRHTVNLAGVWKFHPKWTASYVWTYGTGMATTLPRNNYQFNQFNLLYSDVPPQFPFVLEVANYGKKNDIRLPAYHRLDLEVQYEFTGKRHQHQLSLGAYNVYNRFNPLYYILAERPDETGRNVPQYLEVALMPVIPTLRYRIIWSLSPERRR